jgi:hypothetical protein
MSSKTPPGSTAAHCSAKGVSSNCGSGRHSTSDCSTHMVQSDGTFWQSSEHWCRAAANTTRCLVGCSLGDLSTLALLQTYAPELGLPCTVLASCAAGIATSMALETVVLRVTEDLAWVVAWRTAAGMSLISMLAMEVAENAVELYLTAGVGSGACVTNPAFWQAIPIAMAAGWLVPLPYNYYMLRKYGRGCH